MPLQDIGITHRSAADAWECDQMQHVNVRFLGRRFAEAERAALKKLGWTRRNIIEDSWRFLREVRPGAMLRIESRLDRDAGVLLHDLVDGDGQEPSATLATTFGPIAAASDRPRKGWTDSGLSELGIYPGPGHEDLLRLLNHAAAHIGIERYRQRLPDGRLSHGSAVVAVQIFRHAPLDAGAAVSVQSRLGQPGRTSIRLLHLASCASTGALVVRAEATHVFFDMETRRKVPLPPALRQLAETEMDDDNE